MNVNLCFKKSPPENVVSGRPGYGNFWMLLADPEAGPKQAADRKSLRQIRIWVGSVHTSVVCFSVKTPLSEEPVWSAGGALPTVTSGMFMGVPFGSVAPELAEAT